MRETCAACKQLQGENKILRTAIKETNTSYVELANEALDLHKLVEHLEKQLRESSLK